MMRRTKDSIIDGKAILTLPCKVNKLERITFSSSERQFYQELESRSQTQFNTFLQKGTVGKNYSNILVLLLRLRQACCHPYLIDSKRKASNNWEDSAKTTKVIELLQNIQTTHEKTIVFSQWTTFLDLVADQIERKLQLGYSYYTGKMSSSQRHETIQDFIENPRNTVLLISLRAGNVGLNLTVASRVIICDPFWNPFLELQAIDRAHRIGQQHEVYIHRILVTETIEDRIVALQDNKRRLIEVALDTQNKNQVEQLSKEDLTFLFAIKD